MLRGPISVRTRVYGFLLLLAVLGGGGYLVRQYFAARAEAKVNAKNKEKDSDKKGDAKEAALVELATATRDRISSNLTSTANLRALREVDVAARSEGVVQAVLVEEGEFVKESQVLCRLDDTQLQIRLELPRRGWHKPGSS